MASYYWIKLYHEILEDPKMGQLPDRVWRRCIELFLLAGDVGNEGALPLIADMAWRLRVSEDVLLEDLAALEAVGIVTRSGDTWMVTNFASRQGPVCDAERMARHRERQQKAEYYNDYEKTERNGSSNGPVTNCNAELDTESDIESDTEKDHGATAPPTPPPQPFETVKFDTPEARKLQAKLRTSQQAIDPKRTGPRQFGSLEQKRKFLTAVEALGDAFDEKLQAAMEEGINSTSRAVNFLAACAARSKGGGRGRARAKRPPREPRQYVEGEYAEYIQR